MYLCSGMLAALLCIVVTFVGEQGVVVGGGDVGSEIEPLNATLQKETRPYETNWVITKEPRCCSDCTYVSAGFKCKVKSCLHNCPWARSAEIVLTGCGAHTASCAMVTDQLRGRSNRGMELATHLPLLLRLTLPAPCI